MRAVGESVAYQGLPGIVSSPPLHPAGIESYTVRHSGELLSEMTYMASELEDGPLLREYEPGDTVRLYGSDAVINARNGDKYAATITIDRPSGLRLTHHYPAVPRWHLAIERMSGNA